MLYVERNGHCGLVPSDYLRDISPSELASMEKRSRHSSGHRNKESADQHSTKFGKANHDKMTKPHKHRTHDDALQMEAQQQRELEQTNITSDIRNQPKQYNQIYSGNSSSNLTHKNHRT